MIYINYWLFWRISNECPN